MVAGVTDGKRTFLIGKMHAKIVIGLANTRW